MNITIKRFPMTYHYLCISVSFWFFVLFEFPYWEVVSSSAVSKHHSTDDQKKFPFYSSISWTELRTQMRLRWLQTLCVEGSHYLSSSVTPWRGGILCPHKAKGTKGKLSLSWFPSIFYKVLTSFWGHRHCYIISSLRPYTIISPKWGWVSTWILQEAHSRM